MLMRRLLDGERFSHEGRFYTMHDALLAPRPIQAHLPILVGGSGPRKTLRTVARRADAWNTSGTVEEVRGKVDILAEHCGDVGRDIARIEKSVSFPIVIRDDAAAAADVYAALLAANGVDDMGSAPVLLGSPTAIADAIRPYLEIGFATVIVRMPAPYDLETIERMTGVWELLGE
jgi:alkanesulfonate monooxygenase SsuD/methylene tetrahydromethanopterin reductase-like flavin-dependent oxidoreductase (luciferase family)